MASTFTYTPQHGTTQTTVYTEYVLPAGTNPVPLPVSHGYTRPQKQRGGLGGALSGAWNKLNTKAQQSWGQATDERFRRYFSFPYTEQLYGEFWGEVWTGGQLFPCSVYVSSNYCCLLFKKRDSVSNEKIALKAVIPLRDITTIQRAICLPSQSGSTPIIQAITDPSVRPDSVQIYTNDGKMHQLCNFYNYDKFISTLNYLWKAASTGQALPTTVGIHTETYAPQAAPGVQAGSYPQQGQMGQQGQGQMGQQGQGQMGQQGQGQMGQQGQTQMGQQGQTQMGQQGQPGYSQTTQTTYITKQL